MDYDVISAGEFSVTMGFGSESVESVLRWEHTNRTDTSEETKKLDEKFEDRLGDHPWIKYSGDHFWIRYSISEKDRPMEDTAAISGGIFAPAEIAEGLRSGNEEFIMIFCGAISVFNQYIQKSGGQVVLAS